MANTKYEFTGETKVVSGWVTKETLDELVAALTRCLAHFERIRDQQANPYDSPMMAQARAALAKVRP